MGRIRADKSRRRAHVAFVSLHPELDIGGDLGLQPMQDFPGAIWTVEADSRESVVRLIHNDPYHVPGLRRYQIRAWGVEQLQSETVV